MLRLIHNRDAAGKYDPNILGLLIGIGTDVAFGFSEIGKKVLLPIAYTGIVGRDIAIVDQFAPRRRIAIATGHPKLVAYFAHRLFRGRA